MKEIPIESEISIKNNLNYKDNYLKNENLKKEIGYIQFFIYMNYIILFILSISFYYGSLGGCHEAEYYCLSDEDSLHYLYSKAIECVISSLLTNILFLFVFHKILKYYFFIPVILIYLFFFSYFKGYDLENHSSYNTLVFIIVFILSFLLSEYIIYLIKLIIRKEKRKITIILILTILPFIIFIFKGITNCKNWDRGFDNIKIKNSKKKDACYIKTPKFCTIPTFNNIFDLSRLTLRTCKNKANTNNPLKYFLPDKKFYPNQTIVYPNTINFPFYPNSSVGVYHYQVLNKIKDIKEIDLKNDNSEIKVEFKNNKGKVIIEIKKNETLIKEREKLSKENNVKYKNILFIYIDAISRNHFMRKLPKTTKLISKYYHTKIEKEKEKEKKTKNPKNSFFNPPPKYTSFQFLKYSNFRAATQNNVMPMFYGKPMKTGSGDSILKYLKSKGYITSGAMNSCHREIFDLQHYSDSSINFESFDHENFALFCDPNYAAPNYPFSYLKGIYSSFRKCLYEKDTVEYVFEYTKKFWESYINQRKYSRILFQDAHEGTMEVVKFLDKHLYNFLIEFFEKFYNEDTIIFFTSDHGENMVSIHSFLFGDDYFFEKSLGVFFLILPYQKYQNKGKEIENLINNEQIFLTPYDIHDTVIDIINSNNFSQRGNSVFNYINSKERFCQKYTDDYDDMKRFCTCINY